MEKSQKFMTDSIVGVSTPLRGGPDMNHAWLDYVRRRSPTHS
jgi:hypothetical protein